MPPKSVAGLQSRKGSFALVSPYHSNDERGLQKSTRHPAISSNYPMRLALIAILLISIAFAQTPLATVTGLSTDPSGSAAALATVTLTNKDTGVHRAPPSAQTGAYSFPHLPPRPYSCAAASAGFKNGGGSGVMSGVLPITVRGVQQVGSGASWITPGAQPVGVKVKVDGIETTFGNFGFVDNVSQPSVESIAEFTVNVMTNRAEFGGVSSITSVTKAGTNQLHAVVFYYVPNRALVSRNTVP